MKGCLLNRGLKTKHHGDKSFSRRHPYLRIGPFVKLTSHWCLSTDRVAGLSLPLDSLIGPVTEIWRRRVNDDWGDCGPQ